MVNEVQEIAAQNLAIVIERLGQRMKALSTIKELAIHGKIALLKNDRAELGKVLVEIAVLAGE